MSDPNPKATQYLIRAGTNDLRSPKCGICTGFSEADDLVNDLVSCPHAFVLGCIMDRQINADKAWQIPFQMKQRIGDFAFFKLASLTEGEVKHHMTKPTPLHHYNNRMAGFFFRAIRHIDANYSGHAEQIWNNKPSSAEIVYRFLQFPGVGQKIATMAANILVRDFKIPVSDKYSIDISMDTHVQRVVKRVYGFPPKTKPERLIFFARALHPEYPGITDYGCYRIGKQWSRPKNPLCSQCEIGTLCKTGQHRRIMA